MPVTPWFKILMMLVVLVAHHYTTSPPVAPPGRNDRVYSWQLFDKCSRVIGVFSQLLVVAFFLCEGLLAVSTEDAGILHIICPRPTSNLTAIAGMPPLSVFALLIVLVGSAGRIWCYQALGRLFTYEVTIRPSHTLVTHGLYQWVRHPGYTSLFTHLGGMILLHMAPGSWNYECGIMHTGFAWGVWAWILIIIFSVASLSRRGNVEDSILKAEFGKQWESYSSTVTYKFIPGLI
ncbi:ICMT-domain-containing protein [Mycena belliarum]|uniref:Protein-S-isoprenylcysteine O-methyltransferase n=1 Tax=Mycena belliarum TaxID=1033014 RepID=A0AAD6U021_9AGAR|nr:ICMT-domain-containing protein [Mycena belliae]